ncbi:UNVERIFIED_CONTAM: hypothetical protein PYX00_002691 [Menopon gallinae]|uniref:PH domain-containing protein n=1 Tax=Menopon gallinae TaxID=328185 RepID=A0AAW2HX24_9NEOP
MVPMLKNVRNGIWHAFHSLSTDNNETVYKSKLKVLTANIGILLDLYGVEKGLDHYRSTSTLNFEQFQFYLANEVFSSIPDNLSLRESLQLEDKIEEVCWLVCQKNYLHRDNANFTESTVKHLFRIFCFLADLVPMPPTQDSFQVVMHTSEVGRLSEDLANSLGLEWDAEDFESITKVTSAFRFPLFIAFLEGRFSRVVEPEPFQEAVVEMYRTLIHDVIKKGHLLKRGYLLPSLKEYWFVLQTTELTYYKGQGENEPCGCIPLNPQSRVDALPSTGKDKVHRITISSMDRSYELATFDRRSRLQWMSAIQLAITNSGGKESYQRMLANRRKLQRDAGTLKIKEETLRRKYQKQEMKSTKEKLKQEIEAREAADQKAKELQDSLEIHQNKAKELSDVLNRLEKLLKEETQAKRDEEIVRNLQARVLREEWEKREELERLQEEQRKMLEQEREKRMAFEKLQMVKEQQLKEAEERLRDLEVERQALDKELHAAREKIQTSEKSKEMLEAQLRAPRFGVELPNRGPRDILPAKV